MNSTTLKTSFVPVTRTLAKVVGKEYVDAVIAARAFLQPHHRVSRDLDSDIDFFPANHHAHLITLLDRVGDKVTPALPHSAAGVTSDTFAAATKTGLAPLSGLGYFRIGESGKLYFTAKCEHYHSPLGHAFPGYALLDDARALGIPNATHNNTRGHITRLLEGRLREAAGGPYHVLNLETGSLAGEAALKMILNRFYRIQDDVAPPKYEGKIPVFVVLGDDACTTKGNYHGTTILTQMMRGMWPELTAAAEKKDLFLVRAVRPNVLSDFTALTQEFDSGQYKLAGFFHEIVMMNYAARRLQPAFLQSIYTLCAERDIPTVADEIQSCLWAPDLFLAREYGLSPTFILVGKGFPGGEFAASRLLFRKDMDTLPQFGALITNGQQEIAALAYLVTMIWAESNADITREVGDYYMAQLQVLQTRFPEQIASIDGLRHLAGINFHELDNAKRFTTLMSEGGIDISVQTYKDGCPPCALTKLPLIAGFEVVDWLMRRMDGVLRVLKH